MTRGDWEISFRVYSNPELLCVVRSMIQKFTEVMGFAEQECRSITRAVDESVTNIIRHAYRNRPNRPIEIGCRRVKIRFAKGSREGLEVLLVDHGRAWDPTRQRVRPLDEVRPGGLGLHFIRQAMDTVEYKRRGGANRLRLVRYLVDQKVQGKS